MATCQESRLPRPPHGKLHKGRLGNRRELETTISSSLFHFAGIPTVGNVEEKIGNLLCFLIPLSVSTEKFQVIGPKDPIVAVLGGAITLPCSLFPAMNAENMELRWSRSIFPEAVFIYENQQEQKEEQMPQYKGRTSLVRDFLTQGKAAVLINKVRVSDDGSYICFFKNGDFYEEAILEVKVAGVGSDPQVHIEGPEEDGIRMVCTASGWYPKPQVQWKDPSRKKFQAVSEAHAQDAEGLFSVEATLVVRDSSVRNVTCSIFNPVLGQEKVKMIFIPEPFFPQAFSPWMPVFVVSLTILMILSLGLGYFLKKEHSAKVLVQKDWKILEQTKEEEEKEWKLAMKEADEFQRELDWRKAIYHTVSLAVCSLSAWRKAQLYADWRKEHFQIWSATLDPHSAHRNLDLSQENMSVTWKNNCEVLDNRCSVLGTKGIMSGQYYWEIKVSDEYNSEWAVGVCREDVRRNGWFRQCPEIGFWVVEYVYNCYYAYTTLYTRTTTAYTYRCLKKDSRHIGVFLDYDGGDVSFYNMTDGSHILSFSQISFSGTLFPYFMIRSGTPSLTICSMVDGPKGTPVHLNKLPSSLNEQMSPPEEGLRSGSGGDDVFPGVECPLLLSGPRIVPP
ncbi:PREDICTED: butyrophilin subfamily 1 member A1-like [Chrysochloris asiatica]|uniref:Butyrophilin subfamily 1 member A1-like n=1 Tax=Chrysochloris asiatica TaxID=185453 RepID=A0A9B0X3Z3_CHRAS|nr:PREDICTED: butyrophilin subfamily 1 member A1-like [Chrysochloris asiatica]